MTNWLHTCDIKTDILYPLQDLDPATPEELNAACLKFAEKLRILLAELPEDDTGTDELYDGILAFEDQATQPDTSDDALNSLLAELYDWADDNSVWLGL